MYEFICDAARLQCDLTDKQACIHTAKKIYGLAVIARKRGLLALADVAEQETDLFLKTAIGSLLELGDENLASDCLYAYLVAGNYHGKDYLNNLLIVIGLLHIQRSLPLQQLMESLKGWFWVDFAEIYSCEMEAEIWWQNK